MMKEMKGVCFLYSETGTEGGWWAMQEDGFADKDGSWSYEGLRDLEEGDDFTVYADDGSVLFHGVIHRDTETGAIPSQLFRNGKLANDRPLKQQVGGMWVHWVQTGMDPEVWGALFIGEKRCMLRREESDPKGALLDRLQHKRAMDVPRGTREELYERQRGVKWSPKQAEED